MWISWLMLIILVVLLHYVDKAYSEITDIQLIPNADSTTVNVGTIELNYNGDNVSVCYRGQGGNPHTWSKREAIVACRQLKFKGGWPVPIDVHLNASLYLHNFDCDGGERKLEDCYYASTERCTNSQLAGVQCHNSFEVQLLRGMAPNMGRVEVNYDDMWSSVCYQSKEGDTRKWSFSNVQVVCKELGFPGAMFARRGESDTEMHPSKIYGNKCTEDATETSLADCFPERPIYSGHANASCGTGNNAVAVCAVPGYIGCYSMTAIIPTTLVLINMTINTCRKYCRKSNFAYAGLLRGNECICENNITRVHVSDVLCGEICAGNRDQICGGDTTLSVYHVTDGTCENPFNSTIRTDVYYYGDIIEDYKCDPGTIPDSSRPIQCVMDDTDYFMRWNDTIPQCVFAETTPKSIKKETNIALITGLTISVAIGILLLICILIVCVHIYKKKPSDYRGVDTTDQGTQMSIPYRMNSFSAMRHKFSFSHVGRKNHKSAVNVQMGETSADVQTADGGTSTEIDMNVAASSGENVYSKDSAVVFTLGPIGGE